MRVKKNVDLTESYHTAVLDENIDEENAVIRNVKAVGHDSRNNRKYSEVALEKAVPLYEGITVNLDHPDRTNPRIERKFMEGVGVFKNARYTADGVYGDLHYFKEHPAAGLLVERAKKDKKGFGLSHNADGTCVKTKAGEICESINHVRSLDVVGRPATTSGLFESVEEETPVMVKKSLRELVESYGSAAQKKHLPLLEEEAVMDIEVEIEDPSDEDSGIPEIGFAAAVADIHGSEKPDSEKLEEISRLLAAQTKLRDGKPEVAKDSHAEPNPQLESLQEEVRKLKQEKAISALCESESFKPSEVQMKALCLLESADERVELIGTWKEAGKPRSSGRRELLEDVGSFEDELAAVQANKS